MSRPMGAKMRSNAARGSPSFSSSLTTEIDLALAADHGDVARRGGDGPAQHAHVVAMAAGDDDDVAGVVDGQLREDLFVFRGVDFVRFGKAFAIGERLAVVDDHGAKPARFAILREALRNVAGAENEGARAAAAQAPRTRQVGRRRSSRYRRRRPGRD